MTPEDMQVGRLVAGTLLMALVALAFGIGIGVLWMKEKYQLWTEEELKQKMRSN